MTFFRIQKVAVTASTNDDAKSAAIAGETEGLVVWALEQTAGRGRHGRVWESPAGNLYCSILLRPTCEAKAIGQYSFVAALALCDVMRVFLPQARVTLKWPNDVLIDGKKIGGILLESEPGWLVIGIGINVRHHPDNGLYPSTSLHTTGLQYIDLSKLLDRLLEYVGRWHQVMQKDGFTTIRAAWLKAAEKGVLSVKLPDQTVTGTFIDIDDHGSLRLRLADGAERSIATGDVFVVPKE